MATKKDTDAFERVKNLLREISLEADHIDRFCFNAELQHGDAGEVTMKVQRDSACRMGWLAETALLALGEKPGNTQRHGKAEEWLMAPTSRQDAINTGAH